MQKQRIYMDHNATSLMRPRVKQAISKFLEQSYGNPSSIHSIGRKARAILDESRQDIAQYLGVPASSLIFTSGATEANHLAWNAFVDSSKTIISSDTEHPCVIGAQDKATHYQASVTAVGMKQNKTFVQAFESALQGKTIDFCSLHLANNETGIVMPIQESLNLMLKYLEKKPYVHIDGVQAVGKANTDSALAAADYFTLSGHKLGALPGVGVLHKKDGVPFKSLWEGSSQEKGRRGGTENLMGIYAMAQACKELQETQIQEQQKCLNLQQQLEASFLQNIPDIEIVGYDQERLSNTSCIIFNQTDAQALLVAADMEGIDISTGSACTAGSVDPSHVLLNMGYSKQEASSALRFSLGWNNTEEEVAQVCKIFPKLVERARKTKS